MASNALIVSEYHKVVLVSFERDRITDPTLINAIDRDLTELIDQRPRISLILDLGKVRSMSSQMLGKLVAAYKLVQKVKGRMCVTGLDGNVLPLFKTTRLDRIIDIQPDAEEILLYYQRKPI